MLRHTDGFEQDVNVVFPIDRLKELAVNGVIGSVAGYHYEFMGAARVPGLEPRVRQRHRGRKGVSGIARRVPGKQ